MLTRSILTHALFTLFGALAGAAAFVVWSALPPRRREEAPPSKPRVLYLVRDPAHHYFDIYDDLS